MIVDHIRNAGRYACLGEGFQKALEYLAGYQPEAQPVKRDISLCGDEVFVKVRPYMTKPEAECAYEAHRLYADIHYVAQGSERMGWADAAQLTPGAYNPDKDMLSLSGQGQLIALQAGYFAITFPEDAHMPCVQLEQPELCVKLIAKVKL